MQMNDSAVLPLSEKSREHTTVGLLLHPVLSASSLPVDKERYVRSVA